MLPRFIQVSDAAKVLGGKIWLTEICEAVRNGEIDCVRDDHNPITCKTIHTESLRRYLIAHYGEDLLSVKLPNPGQLKEFTETERASILKLVLGMAIDAYSYDPSASRNAATGSNNGSIQAALQRVGLNADPKTIAKYLTEAAEIYPDAKPQKS